MVVGTGVREGSGGNGDGDDGGDYDGESEW